jgi:hypothetical protein
MMRGPTGWPLQLTRRHRTLKGCSRATRSGTCSSSADSALGNEACAPARAAAEAGQGS